MHETLTLRVFVSVRHRPHQLSLSFSHQEPALLDEAYSIVVEITNKDDRVLDLVVDVLLQPTEVDEAGVSQRALFFALPTHRP